MGNLTFYNPRQEEMFQGSNSATSAKSQKFFQIPTKKTTFDDNMHPLSNSPKNSNPRRQPTIPDDLARDVSQIDPEKFGTVTTILEDPENSAPRHVKTYPMKGDSSRMSKSSSSKVLHPEQQIHNESAIDKSHDRSLKRYDSVLENSGLQNVYKSAQHFQTLRLGKDIFGDGTIKRKLAHDKKLNISTHLNTIKADVSHMINPKHARSSSQAHNPSFTDIKEHQRMRFVRLLEDIGHETQSVLADTPAYLSMKSPNASMHDNRFTNNSTPLIGFKLLDNGLQDSRFLKSPPMQKRTVLLESLQKDIRSTQSPFSRLNDDLDNATPLEKSPKNAINRGPEYLHVVRSKFDSSEGSVLYLLKKELPTVFSTVPSNRQEIMALGNWLIKTLKSNQEDKKLNHKEKFYKADEIYNICFNELIRQVSMDCIERAELLMMIWKAYLKLSEDIIEDIKKREEKVEERGQKEIQKVHAMYNDILKKKEDEISRLEYKIMFIEDTNKELSTQVNTFDKREAEKIEENGKLKSYITKIKKQSQAFQAEVYDLQYKYQKAQKELHQIEDDPLDEQHFIQQQANLRRKAELELDISSDDSDDDRPGFGSAKQKVIELVDKSVCYEHPNGFAVMETQTELTALEDRYDKLLVDKEALDNILLEQVAKAKLVQAAEMMENLSQKAVSRTSSRNILSQKSLKDEVLVQLETHEDPVSVLDQHQDTGETGEVVEEQPEAEPEEAGEIEEQQENLEQDQELVDQQEQEIIAAEEEEDLPQEIQEEEEEEEELIANEGEEEEGFEVPEVPEEQENQEEEEEDVPEEAQEQEEKAKTVINLDSVEPQETAGDLADAKSPALTMITNAKSERIETEEAKEIQKAVVPEEKGSKRPYNKSKTKFEGKSKTKTELEESKRPISKDSGSKANRSLRKSTTTVLKSRVLSDKTTISKSLSPNAALAAAASSKKIASKKETTKVFDTNESKETPAVDSSFNTLKDVARDSATSFSDIPMDEPLLKKKSTVILKSTKNVEPSEVLEDERENDLISPSIPLHSHENQITEETEGNFDPLGLSPFNGNEPSSTFKLEERASPSIYDTIPDSPLRSEASRTKSILRASNMSPIRHSLQGPTSPSKKITFEQGRKSEFNKPIIGGKEDSVVVQEKDIQLLNTIKQRASLKKSKTINPSSPVKMNVSEDEAKKLEKFVEQQEQKIVQLMNMYKVEKQKHDDMNNINKQLEKQVSADHQIIHDLSTFCEDLKKKLELTEQHKERLASILKGIEERNRQINIIDENKFNSSQSSLDVSKISAKKHNNEAERQSHKTNIRKFGSLEANFGFMDLGSPLMQATSPYKSTTNVPNATHNTATQARKNFIREKKSNPGQSVIAKLQIKPTHIKNAISPRSAGKKAIPVKDLLPLKSVLKQITSFYAEKVQMAKDSPITKEQDMGTFIYKQFLNTYGFQQFALKKFTKFISSVKAYTSIGRINKFAKITGLFDASENYNIDETKQYIAGMEYLLTNTTLGTHYPNPDYERKHFAPFVRAMEYARIFGEKSMKHDDLADFRKEIERCKLPDPTGRNSLGLVDVDEFLDRLIDRYRKVVEDGKEHIQVVFKAGDVRSRGCVHFAEFMSLYRVIEGDRGDEKKIGEIFSNSCDMVINEEIGLSLNKLVAFSIEYHIFTEAQQNVVLGVYGDADIEKRFMDLKGKWEREKENLNEMAARAQPVVAREIFKDWMDSIDWLERNLESDDIIVQKTVILKHRVLVGDITLITSKIFTHQ